MLQIDINQIILMALQGTKWGLDVGLIKGNVITLSRSSVNVCSRNEFLNEAIGFGFASESQGPTEI